MDALWADAARHLTRKTDLPDYLGPLTQAGLEAWVAQHVQALLTHGQFEALVQLCYRVDVPETAFRQAIELREPPSIAAELARLLVARELEKAKSRRSYRT
ncbi:MAG: hypothetical protein SFY70_11465 [Bacteroidia bacterium]|nr:hypothetical protein [Bacteroidia bacterium]